jgi:hypothetical protein
VKGEEALRGGSLQKNRFTDTYTRVSIVWEIQFIG